MTPLEARRTAREALGAIGAAHEADELLAHALGQPREHFLARTAALAPAEQAALAALLSRRLAGEPLQYILGGWTFLGLPFAVTPSVLIPRPETETLARWAVRTAARGGKTAHDLCTGSGCVAVALAKFTALAVSASDIDRGALAVARQNTEANGVAVAFCQADLFAGLGVYSLVTANPPYIPTAALATLQKEVRFEPALALDGGEDGLAVVRRIARQARAHITPGGALGVEVGAGQAGQAAALLARQGFSCEILKDDAGIERVVAATLPA